MEAVSPWLLGNVFDISNVAQLERGIGNPASTGLFVMLGAYSESSPAIFQSFVERYISAGDRLPAGAAGMELRSCRHQPDAPGLRKYRYPDCSTMGDAFPRCAPGRHWAAGDYRSSSGLDISFGVTTARLKRHEKRTKTRFVP